MDYKSFLSEVKSEMLYYLPESYEGSQITINQVVKNNGEVLDGLSILKSGQSICPTIYLNSYYEDLKDGKEFDEILGDIAKIRMDNDKAPLDAENLINNISNMKNKIVFNIVGYAANQDRLQNMPHLVEKDMAYIYKLVVGREGEGVATSVITNNLMKVLELDQDSLHQLAIENTPKLFPAQFMTMNDVIKSMMSEEEWEKMSMFMDIENDPKMYVLTNDMKVNGAGALFYPGQMDAIKKQLNSDFYVLPSSIHEVLIVPKTGEFSSYKDLETMVREVNSTGVDPEEVLTGNVYFYDGNELVLAKDYENQIETSFSQDKSVFDRMIEEQCPSMDIDVDPGYEM